MLYLKLTRVSSGHSGRVPCFSSMRLIRIWQPTQLPTLPLPPVYQWVKLCVSVPVFFREVALASTDSKSVYHQPEINAKNY